jgi:hypothetical protein
MLQGLNIWHVWQQKVVFVGHVWQQKVVFVGFVRDIGL